MVFVNDGEYERMIIPVKGLKTKKVYIAEYYIDKFPVSVSEYALCAQRNSCKRDALHTMYTAQKKSVGTFDDFLAQAEENTFPMTFLTFNEAQEYCKAQNKRLPTESEWEKAARGDKEWNEVPWGRSDLLNPDKSREYCTGPVDTRDTSRMPSPFGAYQMGGWLKEWTQDYFTRIFHIEFPLQNPLCTESIYNAYDIKYKEKIPYPRSVKGGCQHVTEISIISSAEPMDADQGYENVGFRCVKSKLNAPEDFNADWRGNQ